MGKFHITYWYGPRDEYLVQEETIHRIAQAGMTLAPLESDDPAVNKAALRLCRQYGMQALVRDSRLIRMVQEADAPLDALAEEITADYGAFDNVLGWMVQDEPNAGQFARLRKVVDALRRADPAKEAYINLFPNYATMDMLQSPSYREHVRQFVSEVRPPIVSYDYYSFLGRDQVTCDEAYLASLDEKERGIVLAARGQNDRTAFFENLEIIREEALRAGVPYMLIVLVSEHGDYRNLTAAEIRWEISQCLVYGCKRLSYFTYWTPEPDDFWRYTNCMAERDGTLTRHYWDVQAINAEAKHIGDELYETASACVMHLHPLPDDHAKAFVPYGAVAALEGETGAVIGFFENGLFAVASKDFQQEASWEFTLQSGTLACFDASHGVWCAAESHSALTPLGNHRYRVTLPAGGMVLLRQK